MTYYLLAEVRRVCKLLGDQLSLKKLQTSSTSVSK